MAVSNPATALLLTPPFAKHTHTNAGQGGEKHSKKQRGTLTNFSGRVSKSAKHACLANLQFVILKKETTTAAKKGEFTIHKPICVVSATLQKYDS